MPSRRSFRGRSQELGAPFRHPSVRECALDPEVLFIAGMAHVPHWPESAEELMISKPATKAFTGRGADQLDFSDTDHQIRILRERYVSELEDFFPWHLDELGIPLDYLFGQSRFLGELYCVWLAPPLGITDREKVQNLSVATVLARAHAVIADNLADGDPCERNLSHAAAVFLAEALSRFSAEVSDQLAMWKHVRHYLCLNAECDRLERNRHWNRLAQFSSDDMRVLGQKTSICFLPAALLAREGGRAELIPTLEMMIATRNVAVQLRDDIGDWRQDLANGNFTLPIVLALQGSGLDVMHSPASAVSHPIAPELVSNVLYGSSLVDLLLDLSDLYLEQASRYARLIEAQRVGSYLGNIMSSNAEIRSSFRELRAGLGMRTGREEVAVIQPGEWATARSVRAILAPKLAASVESAFDQLASRLCPASGLT